MSATTARRAARSTRRPAPALFAACAVAAAGLAITGGGVFAALNATASNATAQNATSGTLSLTMANNGTGFGQSVSNLAPGDIVNRYVNLTQGATMDGKALTLAVADGTPTKLTTDATKGLHVTVTQCSVAWTTTGAGACTGTGAVATVLATNVALSSLVAAPSTLIGGTVTAGSTLNLQVSLTLPDQNETTVNGTPAPTAPATTIQGLSSALTWTFGETQRTSTVTGS
ncbi:CalY family protein [Arthrobacter sp. FW306-2-2C-D06B]|uniref:CalY family protein n=1 Tax=Arthrobacter sp. FW306-2-2C-D06B TaxID=2879618 RepID=UPI001F3E9987|nr:CalY family protein [Arthrobacter sp. FW306-2-2C-D06B]UKA59208.1 CalY family protein [Arthrobacter sp. FW306-2-2C-D06B]